MVLTVLVRWPHRARVLWSWDSVLFALGMVDYDIEAARPHPPGYPVFIALARVVGFFVHDANQALIALSLAASALGVGLLYGFMRDLGSRRAAAAACLLFVFSPVFFLNGVVALSYTTEVPFGVGVAWLAWRARLRPSMGKAAAIGAVGALGMGVRQSLLFTLTVLVVLGATWPWDRWRAVAARAGAAAVAGLAVGLAWFVPMILDTGPARWFDLTRNQSQLVFGHSIFQQGPGAVSSHAAHVALYLSGERILVPVAAGLLALGGTVAFAARRRLRLDAALGWPRGAATLLLVWLLPGVLFTLLVHTEPTDYNSGYALVYVPGLYALFGWLGDAGVRLLEAAAPEGRLRRAASAAALLLLLPLPFLASAAFAHADHQIALTEDWIGPWIDLGGVFPAADTALLTGVGWLWVKWYYPEHTTWSYFPAKDASGAPRFAVFESHDRSDDVPFYVASRSWPETPPHPIPAHIRRVAILESFPEGALRPEIPTETVDLPNGLTTRVFATEAGRPLIEDYLQAT